MDIATLKMMLSVVPEDCNAEVTVTQVSDYHAEVAVLFEDFRLTIETKFIPLEEDKGVN